MEFTLFYKGDLKANGRPGDKQKIRRAFHAQLKHLWEQPPLQRYRHYWQPHRVGSGTPYILRGGDGFRFVPLICKELQLVAGLDITLLRPEPPGSIIAQGGDIDNRLKTLLDALRMPAPHSGEIPRNDRPAKGEDPLFCLLEDDNLVTQISVKTDRLLEHCDSKSEVLLLIHVVIRRLTATFANAEFG